MTIDLKPMLRGEVNRMAIDICFPSEPPYGVEFVGDAHVVGVITNQGGYMRLTATAEIPYKAACARCLAEVRESFTMPFERTVVTEGTLTEEQEEDNIDEYIILDNGMLELDDTVREAIYLAFPMRVLCGEDCPGMCPKCGKPLRDGPCGCPTKEIDPRWAALANLSFDEDGNIKDDD